MNIFTLTDETDLSDKINLDDLFETKREFDENNLLLFNKILNRIHNKIKLTSRQSRGKDQFIWYLVPEMMIGVSRYNVSECTGYILRKLRENEFVVRYTHPNLIFISWTHWIPGYVRQEYKKQTGTVIDGYGNHVSSNHQLENGENKHSINPDDLLLNMNSLPNTNMNTNYNPNINNTNTDFKVHGLKPKNDKDFNSTKNYKPSGIYNNDILKKMQDKFSK